MLIRVQSGARVPLAARPNTVQEIFLAPAQDWGFALWSAGATLPLSVGEAVLRPPSAHSMAVGEKGASMACALQISLLRTGKGNVL